jgi:hypothetical protein
MSLDKYLRDVVREELERAVAPLKAAIAEAQSHGAVIARLAAALGQPLKRGPGRPAKVAAGGGKRGRKAAAGGKRACALIGCGRPTRSKGYCAAHYQKYRNLAKTNRLPADWVEDAAPNSVKDVTLPRGRAGAKALAEARKKDK